jgi:uncharacterized protein (TIGR00725 family)
VVLRGGEPSGQTEGSTTDQRLLDRRGPSDWVHTDPWRVLRIQSEFVEGFGLLAELPRAVSVFGSARTPRDHPHYAAGVAIGAALAQAGYAVITGGGPGAMEAANRGASEAGGLSVGLGIELPFEQDLNEWVDVGIAFTRFPVILFGSEYWAGLLAWVRGTLAETGTINAADLDLITVTDDIAEVMEVIQAADSARRGGEGGGGMQHVPVDQGPLEA